jgi:hypothetical protein
MQLAFQWIFISAPQFVTAVLIGALNENWGNTVFRRKQSQPSNHANLKK